ncbi:MAG: serine/threonine-protein kinase [Proteobacteria bacterium]|nr:serine/threonine-protein kinase [Pseudomonadota bacterium]
MEISDELRIKLTRLIAEGGMGSIHECVIYGVEGFEKLACVKLIKKAFFQNAEFVKRFIAEAKLVADLVHQNIVQVYKLGSFGNQYFILMEYVNGVDLHDFIQKHKAENAKFPVDLGVFIVSRICRGLEYAHNKKDKYNRLLGIVHRDISPKNIMISAEGEVRITDFGVALTGSVDEKDGQYLVGKAAYMSPEQVMMKPVDKRSDIFSLGILMYELLTDQRLFGGAGSSEKVMKDVVSKEIPLPGALNPDIPESLEKIILKALERDVEKRYQDAGELGRDLEYFIYHKGYGPTIQTIATYLNKIFPDMYEVKNTEDSQETIVISKDQIKERQESDETIILK